MLLPAAAFMIVVPIPFIITVNYILFKIFTKIVSIFPLAAGVHYFIYIATCYDKYYVYATLFACLLVFFET